MCYTILLQVAKGRKCSNEKSTEYVHIKQLICYMFAHRARAGDFLLDGDPVDQLRELPSGSGMKSSSTLRESCGARALEWKVDPCPAYPDDRL